mgnify:CR=1 FL=1
MARHRLDGEFRVRQEEQLRRALRDAGEALEWELLAGDPSARSKEVVSDIRRLTQSGLRQLERDLEAEIEEKRAEIRQLKKTVTVLTKLAQKDEEAFPSEVDYQYTAKQGQSGLVTKTQALLLEAPEEAEKAAANLEQRIDRLGTLRDQMIEHLKQRLKTVGAAKSELGSFVRGTDELVDHVLATLSE